ncbi:MULTISPECIES: MspA family porin [Rhodococcus]|uniref:MspA family porin n=1 Tax=Rhodococcus oxybenzonivorans TaxID=1990687 RepID=A0AAE5A5I2_9NOCA|nr:MULTISPECIES: MspA family porin [Rhodococcus]MDV7243306.1 MspA family porin [Rhodococcus oxybenzonivorans]MDV7263993.1 MspA family porin [Rhodococcus oxybenzonivorans]MDV7276734.1 MspA family porin [Rhodococcus oxybenzonivorans]MDV7334435.1 MspA family porin [Rhodococcus oxybenzonivorans]MDV7344590.1 MspA family porin [Rhodococcus oxybenzonivorans]
MIINRNNGVRLAAIGAAAAATIGFFSVGAANADTFVPLPGGSITQTLADGTVVDVNLTDESANISPSMGSTPLHRNVWVSGKASVGLEGEGVQSAYIYPGYVLACQVDFGAEVGAEGGVGMAWADIAAGTVGNPLAGGTSGGIALGPGQAVPVDILDQEYADPYGREAHWGGNYVEGPTGSVSWSDATLGVSGCAGYAQARAFVNVEVETENVTSTVTLWGQPFGIG